RGTRAPADARDARVAGRAGRSARRRASRNAGEFAPTDVWRRARPGVVQAANVKARPGGVVAGVRGARGAVGRRALRDHAPAVLATVRAVAGQEAVAVVRGEAAPGMVSAADRPRIAILVAGAGERARVAEAQAAAGQGGGHQHDG